jgi:hypothetical protein
MSGRIGSELEKMDINTFDEFTFSFMKNSFLS